ncbi:TPA: SNF2-related protein [Staphylococcus aureus]
MLDKVTQIETIKYDRDVSYSYAASRLSTHWTNHNMAWSDFMQKLAQTVRTKEDLTEYNKMSKSEQADIKDVGGFVGGYLKEGKRRAGQVMNRSMLTLDIDYAAQDMTDILSMFYDFAYCLYSTHKHREISPRLRLVIPLKRNVNADEYEAIGRKVADIVGMDYFDDTTYQPHRLMYWPSTSNDAEFFFTYEDLPLLDPDKILNEYVDWTDTLEWPFDMVVIDELSTFKSPKSQRFKSIKKKLPLINRFIGLTGTPSPNSLQDLWAQVYLIDRGERLESSFSRYRERYFKPTHQVSEHIFKWELRDGSEEKIYKQIEDICLSMKAKDYLDMPDRVDTKQTVVLSEKERKVYEELEKNYILESEEEGTVVAQNGASLSQKLLQLSNGAVYTDEEDVRLIHDKKLDKLEEIIEESQGQPILLFYNFKHDKERILQRFKEATTLEDSNYKERWNSGDIKLLIAHPASAGHGLNLQQGGHIIVWFGLTWSLELYQQANARLYRQGQNHTTIIHHIMTDNTIDQRVYKALQNKELTQEELMKAIKAIKARIAKHK